MDTLFDEENEPGIRRVNREKLIDAYMAELEARPPVVSCAGDFSHARATRRRIAEKDVARIYQAAARLGCTISLVPTAPKSTGNLSTGYPPKAGGSGGG